MRGDWVPSSGNPAASPSTPTPSAGAAAVVAPSVGAAAVPFLTSFPSLPPRRPGVSPSLPGPPASSLSCVAAGVSAGPHTAGAVVTAGQRASADSGAAASFLSSVPPSFRLDSAAGDGAPPRAAPSDGAPVRPAGTQQDPDAAQDTDQRVRPSSLRGKGSKRSAKGGNPFAKRYKALRPKGRHPRLPRWDLLTRDVRSSLAGQERRIFQRAGLLVGRFDLQLYETLSEFDGNRLTTVFPTAPSWWPADWGKVPVPFPIEISLYRHQLVEADDDALLWQEVYLLFLEQIAAGWDLEYTSPEEKVHVLPPDIAQAIVENGGFSFLSTLSKTLHEFRSRHRLLDAPIPAQRSARQHAWARIREARSTRRVDPSVGGRSQMAGEAARDGELRERQQVLAASTMEATLHGALAGSSGVDVSTLPRLVALAASSLRHAIQAETARRSLADLVRASPRRGDRTRDDEELERVLSSFPELSKNLPILFHGELDIILFQLGLR